ncbi:hypothetical protein MNBD_GAMMA20-1196 [hydrothermal vent metagenome]|uniref:RES domain-containing protein n=1 Tax=hydrothermal vent metagenome TaxID=652676 RepID=A0A3B1A3F7_9ZZZZ
MSQLPTDSRIVCADCLSRDSVLQGWLKEYGGTQKCCFCGGENRPALPVNDVAKHVLELLENAGYKLCPIASKQNIYEPTHEVLADVLDYRGDSGGIPHDNSLIGHLCRAIDAIILSDDSVNKTWVKPSSNIHGSDYLYSWSGFVGEISYRRRFLFLSSDARETEQFLPKYSPGEMLKKVGNAVREMNLISEIQKGKEIYRARVAWNGETFSGKEQLGAPPSNLAKAGRMNPPGISYFYAADSLYTACAEVCTDKPETVKTVYVGKWETTKDLNFIDLSNLGELPSFFAPGERDKYVSNKFLRRFIEDVCRPLPRDDIAQLTYIPAQVVSEYFRTVLPDVDGVIFTSAQDRKGKCVVVFPSDDDTESTSYFGDRLKLRDKCPEGMLVGNEPDLIIQKESVEESLCPWDVTARL